MPKKEEKNIKTHQVKEGKLVVPGGRVWYKIVGEKTDVPPLLVVHGGPGFTHNYLRALEDLADERQVIFWDQLGCGYSETPSGEELWTMKRSLDEVDAVVEGLELDRYHLFGNSWGGMLVQQYTLDRNPNLGSLTISNSLASMPKFAEATQRLKKQMDPEWQKVIDYYEENELYESPIYTGAIGVWYQTYVCRMDPWPRSLEDSFANIGMEIYEAMVGPSDFNHTGNLKNWDIRDRLHEIDVPTLVVAGKYDECVPEDMYEIHQNISNSEYAYFENSSHMPFEEEREHFMEIYRAFLSKHDSNVGN